MTIKHYAGDEVAISAGLNPGEKIVTSANFLVDSESRLKGVLAPAGQAEPSKTPECPAGQEWNAQMKHCMSKVGQ